jgi:signal peptidase I
MTQPNKRPPVEPTPENPWIEGLKTVGLSAILALGIRQFVAEARFIPSGSMFPTLLIDDRLIVDKVSYKLSLPKRGDVVVFMPPDESVTKCGMAFEPGQPIPKPKDAFIKRVIGLPGETIEVKDRQLFVNDQPIKENYTIEIRSGRDDTGKDIDPIEVRNGQVFISGTPKEDYKVIAPQSNYPKTTVPKDFYLVMGDNRNNSCDGRFWGMVPKDNIIGKAVTRFWPLTRIGGIDIKTPYSP